MHELYDERAPISFKRNWILYALLLVLLSLQRYIHVLYIEIYLKGNFVGALLSYIYTQNKCYIQTRIYTFFIPLYLFELENILWCVFPPHRSFRKYMLGWHVWIIKLYNSLSVRILIHLMAAMWNHQVGGHIPPAHTHTSAQTFLHFSCGKFDYPLNARTHQHNDDDGKMPLFRYTRVNTFIIISHI